MVLYQMKNSFTVFLLSMLTLIQTSCSHSDGKGLYLKNNSMKKSFDTIQVAEKLPAIKKGTNMNLPAFITKRLEQMVGASLRNIFEKKGLKYPPEYILIRVFKKEKECELWAGNKNRIDLALILPVCAMDFIPGTKLQQGDGKTPEGFYECSELYGSNLWFMWINLDPDHYADDGVCGKGSSFRLWLDYPNILDAAHSRKFIGAKTDPGGAICSHGNCVSAGCISFENVSFLPVFLLARYHKTSIYGKLQMHVFPFRFSEKLKKDYSAKNKHISSVELYRIWNNLEEGYRFINEKKKPLKFSISADKYSFVSAF